MPTSPSPPHFWDGPRCRLWLELLFLPGTDSLLPKSTYQKKAISSPTYSYSLYPGGSLIPVEYSCLLLTLSLVMGLPLVSIGRFPSAVTILNVTLIVFYFIESGLGYGVRFRFFIYFGFKLFN